MKVVSFDGISNRYSITDKPFFNEGLILLKAKILNRPYCVTNCFMCYVAAIHIRRSQPSSRKGLPIQWLRSVISHSTQILTAYDTSVHVLITKYMYMHKN